VEEMRHADTLVQRMLSLGVAPAASQLRPVGHGPDLASLLRQNLALEDDLVNLYAEAARFCHFCGDTDNQQLFQQLLTTNSSTPKNSLPGCTVWGLRGHHWFRAGHLLIGPPSKGLQP
jgi:bacterioferritin (cytochrome b1)